MAESSTPKLTKKQQKSAQYKAGKGSKGASGGGSKRKDDSQADVPEEDMLNDGEQQQQARGAEAPSSVAGSTSKSTKRKRMEQQGGSSDAATKIAAPTKAATEGASSANKVSFDEDGNAVPAKKKLKRRKKSKLGGGGGDGEEGSSPRLIVFVGNMSFKTTSEQISKHFKSHCGETPGVRLLTTKSDPSKISASKLKSVEKGKASDPTVRSKGCAFVQFTKAAALQKALGLHHTQFEGRLINVELTAGGGGSSSNRTKRIQEKNAKLDVERSKLHEKYWKPQDEERKRTNEQKRESGQMVGPPRRQRQAEGQAQWGTRRGDSSGDKTATSSRPKKGMPKWMASGANAVRLQD